MKRQLRNVIFIVTSVLFYLIWNNGGELAYGKFLSAGMQQITAKFSSIQEIRLKKFEEKKEVVIYFEYPDRTTQITMEYCLPTVLLFAWQFSLFFDYRISKKTAFKFLAINFSIVFILQTLLPLLLFNISQSKIKSISFFIGLQIFEFIIFFLILKDSIIIRANDRNKNQPLNKK